MARPGVCIAGTAGTAGGEEARERWCGVQQAERDACQAAPPSLEQQSRAHTRSSISLGSAAYPQQQQPGINQQPWAASQRKGVRSKQQQAARSPAAWLVRPVRPPAGSFVPAHAASLQCLPQAVPHDHVSAAPAAHKGHKLHGMHTHTYTGTNSVSLGLVRGFECCRRQALMRCHRVAAGECCWAQR